MKLLLLFIAALIVLAFLCFACAMFHRIKTADEKKRRELRHDYFKRWR